MAPYNGTICLGIFSLLLFLVFMFFVPVFIFIWVYFPLIGFYHGENIGSKRLGQYRQELCGGKQNYWNKCLRFNVENIDEKNSLVVIEGRLIIRSGNMLGLLTQSGPVTITMPQSLFQKTEINQCFENGCDDNDIIKGLDIQ